MPTKSLGTLTLDIIAKIGGFEKGMDQAARISEKRLKQIQDTAKKVGAGIALGLTGAAAGFTAMVKSAIDTADEFNQLSQKVGIATDDLSKLAYAAKLADVDTDSLQSSLVKLSKAAVDSKDGTGTAAAAFDALGVSVTDANGQLKSTEQLFLETADAFASFADGPEKAAAAVAIFGKAGADLIPLLNGGAAAIKAAGEELETFGGVITPAAAAAADQFKDNLDKLKTASQGLATQLAADLLPELVGISEQFVTMAKEGEAAAKFADGFRVVLRGLTGVAIVVSNVFQVAGDTIGAWAAIVASVLRGDFSGAVEIAKLRIQDLKTDLNDVVHAFDGTTVAAKAAAQEIDAFKDPLAALAATKLPDIKLGLNFDPGAFAKAGDAAKKAAKEIDIFTRQFEVTQEALANINTAVAANQEIVNGRLEEARQIFEATRTPAELYAAELEKLNVMLERGDVSLDTYNRRVEQLQAGLREIGETTEEVTSEMSVFADEAARNMQDAFADFLFDPFDEGLRGMLRNFALTLQKMAADAAAAQIFEALAGKASSLFSTLVGAGLSYFTGGVSPTGTYTSFPGRASGGTVAKNMPYMVGERGPELFVPDLSGSIVPNQSLGAPAPTNIRVVNLFDSQPIADFLTSAAGEEVLVNWAGRNSGKLRTLMAS